MKSLFFLTIFSAILLSGCESVSSRVRDRFTTVSPQTRVFSADKKVVFNAGLIAVKNVGLLLGRKSLSSGLIEAYAPIRQGDEVKDTRQTTLKINLSATGDNQTEVALLVSEDTEGNFPGGVSQQDLREHSLYELYFTALQQVLLENGSIKAPANH